MVAANTAPNMISIMMIQSITIPRKRRTNRA